MGIFGEKPSALVYPLATIIHISPTCKIHSALPKPSRSLIPLWLQAQAQSQGPCPLIVCLTHTQNTTGG